VSEVDCNFALFWPQSFFGEGPEFFDRYYIIEHTSDHVAMLEGDRPRKLRDLALEKRKERKKFQ